MSLLKIVGEKHPPSQRSCLEMNACKQTNKQANKQTNTQTNKHTQTNKQSHKQTNKYKTSKDKKLTILWTFSLDDCVGGGGWCVGGGGWGVVGGAWGVGGGGGARGDD